MLDVGHIVSRLKRLTPRLLSIKAIEFELNKRWKFVIRDSEAQREIFDFFKKEMTSALEGRQDLIDALVPDFAVGCRRLTPAPGFLAAL